VDDDLQALHCESAVSGESQAQSVGSPVNGGSSMMSHSGSGGMCGMQALPIVSEINTTSQEPLANYMTILQPLRARSPPTQMTIDVRSFVVLVVLACSCASFLLRSQTPNFTTSYPESSRGAPPVPSVPSQLPTSLYTASVSALTNKQTCDQGKHHDPPIA
jgi:hypothetical protein